MRQPTRSAHAPALVLAVLAVLSAAACVDVAGMDVGKYVERDEKHFAVAGRPDVTLSTFDGPIEVRPWDKPEVQVVIERRGYSKKSVETIQVSAEASGDHVTVSVTIPKITGIHFNDGRSAKLIVSMPASSDLKASSNDGSIDVERISGRLELRSGDGNIRGRSLDGDIRAHTGDGSIKLDEVSGALTADAGDGSVTVGGKLTTVRARTGDGSVHILAEQGSKASGDWDISSGDGSVTLSLPDDFSAELDVHSGDGSIHLRDVTLSNVTGEIRKHDVHGQLGAGGAKIRVRTGDGSIVLKRP
jgi:DUF4097 and DUF4098 domain-containing protein YvlB